MEPVKESGFGYIIVQGRCCRNLQLTILCSFVAGEAIARIIPHRPVHSGTKMVFLPSVCVVTLGKEANICTFWASLCRVSGI